MSFDCGKCEKCPNVQGLLDEVKNNQHNSRLIAEEAMQPMIDMVIAPAIFGLFKQTLGSDFRDIENEEILEPGQVASSIRKAAGKVVEDIDVQTEALQLTAEDLMRGCQGPLSMRATKTGRVITATICNSPMTPNGSDFDIVVVHRADAK